MNAKSAVASSARSRASPFKKSTYVTMASGSCGAYQVVWSKAHFDDDVRSLVTQISHRNIGEHAPAHEQEDIFFRCSEEPRYGDRGQDTVAKLPIVDGGCPCRNDIVRSGGEPFALV